MNLQDTGMERVGERVVWVKTYEKCEHIDWNDVCIAVLIQIIFIHGPITESENINWQQAGRELVGMGDFWGPVEICIVV